VEEAGVNEDEQDSEEPLSTLKTQENVIPPAKATTLDRIEEDSIIPSAKEADKQSKKNAYTPCVLLDYNRSTGKVQRCNSENKLQSVNQMYGTWEIDHMETQAYQHKPQCLGVCHWHFMWDHQQLHTDRSKTQQKREGVQPQNSNVVTRECLFCKRKKTFVSRGGMCPQHLWCIQGKNIQVPCTGLKACTAFTKNGIANPATIRTAPHFVCTNCFQDHGGHLFIRSGKSGVTLPDCTQEGLHEMDTTRSLEAVGKWILTVASTENATLKKQVLESLIPAIHQTDEAAEAPPAVTEPLPSLFTVMALLQLKDPPLEDGRKLLQYKMQAPKEQGAMLGSAILASGNEIKQHKQILENPEFLQSYHDAFPCILRDFFYAMVNTILEQKFKVAEKNQGKED